MMKCPVDGEVLVMSDRNGVEIDYCPRCRGVWLDRGELDKIIERSAAGFQHPSAGQMPTKSSAGPSPKYRSRKYRDDDDHDDRRPYYRKSKKHSFLKELFDFD